ncbi:uncharacterized protein LOC114714482 [Neltuma alba]|uniref:uncharacterized protein LOC114714482 n=1 Tax=Neltuma alba TaxID=207710 RepID=UPI0010A2E6E5|nr:uncharacterized protein LOC114714482 [Prosopis alba]
MLSAPPSSVSDSSVLVSKGAPLSSSSSNKAKVYCDHCKKPGHTRDRCWDIHGKPADWKPRKGKSRGYQASQDPDSSPLTTEQLHQLVTALKGLQTQQQPRTASASAATTGSLIGEDDWHS